MQLGPLVKRGSQTKECVRGLMAIKAVLFDLDETLLMEDASVEAAFHATCAGASERYRIDPKELTQTVRRHARELWRALPTADYCQAMGIASWEGLSASFMGDDTNLKTLYTLAPSYRREAWSSALADYGVHDPSLVRHLVAKFIIERRKRHVLFADAEPTLKELKKSYLLGLITNGPPDLQREKLLATKLTRYFEIILISGELGMGKPEGRIFEHALQALRVAPNETVMVGDSLERDIAGAKGRGIFAVWVRRSDEENPKRPAPDAVISQLSDMPSALKAL